ncbi:MAG: ABC transporter ATP-binding protein [Streptosporangiales bacterium]
MASLLATRGLTKEFGHLRVLDSVDIEARDGEILGLIGPNGSGKSTWMNCVSGAYRPSAGRVTLKGSDVTGKPPHVIYHRGLSRTFQLLENFAQMTVRDNLVLSGQERRGTIASRLLRSSTRVENELARSLAEFLGIAHLLDERVATLSYGQQKLCDIGMALMSEPDILLLDEPMAGVNPTLINEIVERLVELNRAGTTLVVVEHNMRVMMELCHRMVVLDHGELIADGEPGAIRQDPDVIAAYFGSSSGAGA